MKTKEEILKKHTSINKRQFVDDVWNAGIVDGIKTSGHFVLFEDCIVAMQEFSDQQSQEKDNKIKDYSECWDKLENDYVQLQSQLSEQKGEIERLKELPVKFAKFILTDYDMDADEDGNLCFTLAGTSAKFSPTDLFNSEEFKQYLDKK